MAFCHYCDQDMLEVESCIHVDIISHGKSYEPVQYGEETGWKGELAAKGSCPDCNVSEGGYHHPGCDIEQCPICKGQIISCGCKFD